MMDYTAESMDRYCWVTLRKTTQARNRIVSQPEFVRESEPVGIFHGQSTTQEDWKQNYSHLSKCDMRDEQEDSSVADEAIQGVLGKSDEEIDIDWEPLAVR